MFISLLTANSESFVLEISYKEMNPEKDTHQTFNKMLWENKGNAIQPKVLENYHLTKTYPNP